jgi:hypothetical protein
MPEYEANVRGGVQDAADYLVNEITASSASSELVEKYSLFSPDGKCCTVLIFEKYYMRNESRISLTITIDDLAGATRVSATTSGGGQGAFFSFDWGAGRNFITTISDIIERMR